jgi:fermentation-respiration switch protein FrsA (DUF1100 family)
VNQARLIFVPDRVVDLTPAAVGLAFESLDLETDDGGRVTGWYVPGPGDDVPVILVCHGNAGDIADRLDLLRAFHAMGFGSLIFDYRGYGDSPGRPTEDGTYRDARAAARWLGQVRRVPAARTVVYGRSLGGGVAARIAAELQPAGLVMDSSFTTLPELAGALYPLLPARWLCRLKYDNVAALQELRCPVLVAHSRQDEIAPFRLGKKLFEAAREPREFVELAGNHNAGGLEYDVRYQESFAAFVRRCMQ